MTTAPALIAGLSMCPEPGCCGQLHECRFCSAGSYHCTINPHHWFHDDDLAACLSCTGPQNSDRVTVAQALREGWLLVEGKGLICPDHVGTCEACQALFDLEAVGTCPHQCADCPCGECDAYDRGEALGDMRRDGEDI